METKDCWLILDVYVDKPEKINMVLKNVENLICEFKRQKLLTGFYFNRYKNFPSYLFSLNLNYTQYLESGNVREELVKVFKDNNFHIYNNSTITKIVDKKWEIKDGDKLYLIENTSKHLNIYFASNEFRIKLGFYQIKGDAKEKLYEELDKMETKDIKENMPDLNVVDGVTIDYIKTVSYELREIVKEKLNGKSTSQQMFYVIHLLMNQLDYSYSEELLLYQNLFSSIHYELHKKQ